MISCKSVDRRKRWNCRMTRTTSTKTPARKLTWPFAVRELAAWNEHGANVLWTGAFTAAEFR